MRKKAIIRITIFCLLLLCVSINAAAQLYEYFNIETETAIDPMSLFEQFHIERTLRMEVKTYGISERRAGLIYGYQRACKIF